MPALFAVLAALAALLSYRFLEEWTGKSWLPAALRAAGWGTLTLLLLNASCPTARPSSRPTVLLDGSLSMQAAGARWTEALALARRSGEVRLLGVTPGDTTPSGGRSRFAAAIAAAGSAGRPVIFVTDGELEDAEELPADSLHGPEIRVLRRRQLPDVAISRVEGTARLTPSDSLRIEVEATSVGATAGKTLELEVREGSRVWLRGKAVLDSGGRATTALGGALPPVPPGTHVLTIAIRNAADSEPRDDTRLLLLSVVPTPGVVLLASPPTWESKFLLETLRATTALPVRGYLEVERGVWRRAGDLQQAPAGEVANAARRADLLVTLGSGVTAARGSRARGRWSWPGAARLGQDGDWYVSIPAATPIGAAFTGLAVDSFPPGTAVLEQSAPPGAWVGLTAQAGRRGMVRPVLIGRDSAEVRQLVTGIDGLWRWAFRGGSSEQGYRALVASAVSWLLGGGDSLSGAARLQREVVQRGRPAVFEWKGSGRVEPLAIEWSGGSGSRRDTLVFDGAGRAEVLLPPGVWHYRLSGGGEGTLAVEEYSDEWLPKPATVAERPGSVTRSRERVPLRSWIWLFGLSIAAFAGEWLARRRMGLR
ncbi:MAG TPA: hypothetical protein VGQ69_10795 [Gemmatimonadales bacterium]|jgi:hypothetical protein|nr:hypothetical protein [Gemmatimonadales bacterium]